MTDDHKINVQREIVKSILTLGGRCTNESLVDLTISRTSGKINQSDINSAVGELLVHGCLHVKTPDILITPKAKDYLTCSTIRKAASEFGELEQLALAILPYSIDNDDAAHDTSHLVRVWKNVVKLQAKEGGDLRVLAASVMLHDAINIEKNSHLRSMASQFSAQLTKTLLNSLYWDEVSVHAVQHAVSAHSHSAGIEPRTIEAKILQDADRLDAIGAVGVARCFHVAGRIHRDLYDFHDPMAANRPVDDIQYTLDHFNTKLFSVSEKMNTETGKKMAEKRTKVMRNFYDHFLKEIG